MQRPAVYVFAGVHEIGHRKLGQELRPVDIAAVPSKGCRGLTKN